ncbi:AfsR/SARP family transcriptional regulator [Allocatelliglobosispora scoriae]|uniref:AfsR/SARP family transcriptional regulator n=1 Tax=Allocatelliglobosispora scoriae TaxID=643052 RepID=UPI001617EE77|nr:BTAD domain-containing putative transcriptional regulator [Allocatelliglobosispora scoriae]
MEIRCAHEWRPVAGGKARTLLSVLMIHAGTPVPVARLVEELWRGAPPASARSLVRGYVLALRRSLGAEGPEILTAQADAYLLDVAREAVDAYRFEQLAADGQGALRTGDVDRAVRLLGAALTLWRGPAFSGVAASPLISAYVSRLEELRLAALEARLESDLLAGRAEEVLGEVRQLMQEHPARERIIALWMRALHAQGRRAEALSAYVDARRRLAGEFGIEPGPYLRQAHRDILAEDGAADAAGTPTADRTPPARPREVPWHAPASIGDFTGRHAELAGCLKILEQEPGAVMQLVAISGRAGVGKTTLAIHTSHLLHDTYPDGRLYADLRGDSAVPAPADEVLGRFLRALGVQGSEMPETTDERAALLRSRLAGRKMLILLDNASSEQQVRPLLPGTGPSAAVVVSRRRLSALDGSHFVDLDVFSPECALSLLGRIAGVERVMAEPDAASTLAALCGHLPLAVRIAAARVSASPETSLSWLVQQLMDERSRLDELSIGDLDVRTTIAAGYQGLSAAEQRALRRLSLLDVADFPAWVVAAVADLTAAETRQVLRTLVDRRLLDETRVDQVGQLRYGFHSLVKLFARELAQQRPAAAQLAAIDRALEGWLALARAAGAALASGTLAQIGPPRAVAAPPGGVEVAARSPSAWFEAERAAIAAAVAQAADLGRTDLSWGLAAAAHSFYELRDLFDDGQHVHETALRACRAAGDQLGEAVMLRNLADLYSSKPGSELGQKLAFASAALHLFRQVRDTRGEADALYLCATVHRMRGEHAETVARLEQSLQACRSADYRLGELHVWQLLGMVRRQEGHNDEALVHASRALTIARELASSRDQSVALTLIGIIHRDQDEPEQAERALVEAIDIAEESADPVQLAFLHGHLGALYAGSGHPRARPILERGLELSRASRSVFGQALALNALGRLDLAEGDAAAALDRLCASAQLYREAQNSYAEAKALAVLSEAYRQVGDAERARANAGAAVLLFRRLGNETEADQMELLAGGLSGG